MYDQLLDTYKEYRKAGRSRHDFLVAASRIEGLYIPELYEVTYNEDGTLKSFTPTEGAPASVKRQVVADMSDTVYPEKPVVPYIRAVQDRVALEIQRGDCFKHLLEVLTGYAGCFELF